MAFNFLDPGGFVSGGKKEYGTKPVVPKAIDYGPALKSTIATNKEVLPSLTELGLLSTDALNQLIERLAPGSTALRDTITSGYQALAKGEIPADVQRNIRQTLAEQGVAGGVAGSDFNLANLGRTLGTTSLELSNIGRQGGGAWFANLASRAYDPTRSFLGKEEAVRQTEFNWQRDWLAAQVSAAPDPVARGRLDTNMGLLGMVTGVYSGAAPLMRQQPSYAQASQSPGSQTSSGGGSFFGSPYTREYPGGYDPNSYNPEFDVGAGGAASSLGAEQEAFDWAF